MANIPRDVWLAQILCRLDDATLLQVALCSHTLYALYRLCGRRVTIDRALHVSACLGYVQLLEHLRGFTQSRDLWPCFVGAVRCGQPKVLELFYDDWNFRTLFKKDAPQCQGRYSLLDCFTVAVGYKQSAVQQLVFDWLRIEGYSPEDIAMALRCGKIVAGDTNSMYGIATPNVRRACACTRSQVVWASALSCYVPEGLVESILLEAQHPLILSLSQLRKRFAIVIDRCDEHDIELVVQSVLSYYSVTSDISFLAVFCKRRHLCAVMAFTLATTLCADGRILRLLQHAMRKHGMSLDVLLVVGALARGDSLGDAYARQWFWRCNRKGLEAIAQGKDGFITQHARHLLYLWLWELEYC